MEKILNKLLLLSDKEYAAFQANLIPTIGKDGIIGVRVPVLRNFAKELSDEEKREFINELPHRYLDENIFHSILLSNEKDFDMCIKHINDFLPFIDNWAVCDTLNPRVFAKHKNELIEHIKIWASSSETYICRFGIGMLMGHYLDDAFLPEYLDIPAAVQSDEYYVNMMVAWYFATALAKQWDSAVKYVEERRLPIWTHNKTIRKAAESYRITPEQKEYLKKLKIQDK